MTVQQEMNNWKANLVNVSTEELKEEYENLKEYMSMEGEYGSDIIFQIKNLKKELERREAL